MHRSASLLSMLCAVALVCACGAGQKIGGFSKGKMPSGYTWEGNYFCDFFGQMSLSQSGSSVVGQVEYGEGKIEGTADGNILRFTWSQKSGPEGLGSQKKVTGQGVFQYVVAKAGTDKESHNIDGTWGYDQDLANGGKWACYKSKKDILKIKKQLIVNEEGTIAAAEDQAAEEPAADDEPPAEGETKLKNVGVKKKTQQTKEKDYETPPGEKGDERLEDLGDLDM